ncbi:MAG: UbiX family flavin prenyltransferase [Clostridia bacterium]|nr:MAG: UbiX family flavin prenyltransferase [Clostridia bacterium]
MTARLIVGMSGATGSIYGIRLLEVLRDLGVETHLVMSRSAEKNISLETKWRVEDVRALATVVYPFEDIAAAISSGSFLTCGMVVAPCSIRTLSGIANSYNENLLVRAADVTLKERRRLVLLVRETPLHTGHLRLMTEVTEIGGIILPPMPAFYHHPQTIDDIINQTVGKALDMFGIEHHLFCRWSGGEAAAGVVQGPAGER